MRVSCSAGGSPSGLFSVMPSRTWPRRPATRTMKNSSRLLAQIDRKRTRSRSGWFWFSASSSTRRLNCSHDSSRLMNRSGLLAISLLAGGGAAAGAGVAARASARASPADAISIGITIGSPRSTMPHLGIVGASIEYNGEIYPGGGTCQGEGGWVRRRGPRAVTGGSFDIGRIIGSIIKVSLPPVSEAVFPSRCGRPARCTAPVARREPPLSSRPSAATHGGAKATCSTSPRVRQGYRIWLAAWRWQRARRLLHLSPRAGRGRFASGALAKRSKSGEGACPQAQTRGYAPSPGFRCSAALRSESAPGSSPGQALSPHAGRGRIPVQPDTWLTKWTDYMVDTFRSCNRLLLRLWALWATRLRVVHKPTGLTGRIRWASAETAEFEVDEAKLKIGEAQLAIAALT